MTWSTDTFPQTLQWIGLLALCLLVASGCAEATLEEAPATVTLSDDQACEDARVHMEQCLGSSLPEMSSGCDPQQARLALGQSCEALMTFYQGKADGFGWSRRQLEAMACRLGWTYYCDPTTCDAPAQTTSCDQLRTNDDCSACAYYSCMETRLEMSCGPRGYFRGYGQKYCQRFSVNTADMMSPKGKQWVKDVRQCLMAELDLIVQTPQTCDEVRTKAFDSHPKCYVDTGLCNLPPSDWIHIVNTIAPWDNDIRQVVLSGVGCLKQWFGRQPYR